MDWDIESKLVIIGGGGSGLAAAAAAAEKGLKEIIILEARHAMGGNSVFPRGIFATESPTQKRLKIEAGNDEAFKKAMAYAHWKNDPRLVRSLVNRSGDTISWLEERGVEFVRVEGPAENALSTYHMSKGPKTTGTEIVNALADRCQELGTNFLFQTRAKKLVINEAGAVTGVLAETKDKEIKINADAVIIATGGFSGNKKIMKKYFQDYNEENFYHAGIPNKGDGLLMAFEVGAENTDVPIIEMAAPRFPWSSHLRKIVTMPETIWLNNQGERFCDENATSLFEISNIIYRQPGKISYTVFDENIKEGFINKLVKKNLSATVNQALSLQADKGRIKVSNSWEVIAKWMGADPGILTATIDDYNSFSKDKYDKLFAKDIKYLLPLNIPPYYAIRCCISIIVTHGGIKINYRMQVLDHQNKPIPGLYAAGVDTGGVDSGTYNSNLLGHSFGFAVISGRMAGEYAAEFIKDKKRAF